MRRNFIKIFAGIVLFSGFLIACNEGNGPGKNISEPLYMHHQLQGLSQAINEIRMGGAIPVQVTTNGNDMSYKTTLNVGDTDKLLVYVQGSAAPVEFTGRPLVAEYYHMGKLLIVSEGADNNKAFHYFSEPIRWSTAKR